MSYPELESAAKAIEHKELLSLRVSPAREAVSDPDVLMLQPQQRFARIFAGPRTPYKRLHLLHHTGTGKCLARNTIVATMNGPKYVQNIVRGDVLIGPDGTPRIVSDTGAGVGKLYEVNAAGTVMVCNYGHILTLFRRDTLEVVDVSISKFIRGSLDVADFCAVISGSGSTIRAENFTITPREWGEYFGFVIDRDGRYLLENGLVTHNTLAAVSVAHEFVKVYSEMWSTMSAEIRGPAARAILDGMVPNIVVLGFAGTRSAFVKELASHPEFGYVSTAEFMDLRRLSQNSADYERYSAMKTQIKRRIGMKSRGGFYRFYGYDEFVGKLFRASSAEHSITDGELEREIAAGTVTINKKFLDSFAGSLLICDEVHNTYNMQQKNNRGIALQYVLDNTPNLRFLSMSATPIGNSPSEIVDLLDYLVTPEKRVPKQQLFTAGTLRPGALDTIGRIAAGKISFFRDSDTKQFPSHSFAGKPLVLQEAVGVFPAGARLPFEFVECEMQEFQWNACIAAMNSGEVTGEIDDTDEMRVSAENYSVFDIAFPGGLYRSADITSALADANWRRENGVVLTTSGAISGPFLRDLSKYSAKYATFVREVRDIRQNRGKVMVYHERVRLSGALFVAEILRDAGFGEYGQTPLENTMCIHCGTPKSVHKTTAHLYTPAMFMVVHGGIDKSSLNMLVSRFNASSNSRGEECMVIVGSRIIRESYDFKCIRRLFVLSLPTSIPTMIQVFGRCIRKGSHISLPESERTVKIAVLVNTHDGPRTPPEVLRYAKKLSDYSVVRQIEDKLAEVAIDAPLFQPELAEKLGTILNVATPITSTFDAYGYNTEEVELIEWIIHRLFLAQPAWRNDELIRAIGRYDEAIGVNPAMFGQNNVQIALHNVIGRQQLFDGSLRSIVAAGEFLVSLPVDTAEYGLNFAAESRGPRDYDWRLLSAGGVVSRSGIVDYGIGSVFSAARDAGPITFKLDLNPASEFAMNRRKLKSASAVAEILFSYSPAFQESVVRSWIEHKDPFFARFRSMYKNLGVFSGKDGYFAGGKLKRFIGGIWRESNRESVSWSEDGKIVGMLEPAGSAETAFKLRSPIGVIRETVGSSRDIDTRLIERGATCSTKSKVDLTAIAKRLGITVSAGERIGSICSAIRAELLRREIAARKAGTRSKHLYGWWDYQQRISGMLGRN